MEIKNVNLSIYAQNGQKLEIPLEIWQVDIIAQMLGLFVDTATLKEYKMSSKECVDERMEQYIDAICGKHRNHG